MLGSKQSQESHLFSMYHRIKTMFITMTESEIYASPNKANNKTFWNDN